MPDNTDDPEAYETWDCAAAEKRAGGAAPAVTVSIKLAAGEFAAVAERAEREGASVTDFMRRAALDAAKDRSSAS